MKMICFLICCHFTIFRDACLARILVRRLNKLAFVYTVCMLWKLLWTFRDLALRKHNINDSQIIRAFSVSGHGCFPCDEIEKQKQWHIVVDSVQTEGGMSSNYNWVIERWLSVAKYEGVWGVVGRERGVITRRDKLGLNQHFRRSFWLGCWQRNSLQPASVSDLSDTVCNWQCKKKKWEIICLRRQF